MYGVPTGLNRGEGCKSQLISVCAKPQIKARYVDSYNEDTSRSDMVTFRFHYPRNDILFIAPLTQPPEYYDRVVTEWAIGNYVRVALILTAVVLVTVSMIRIARQTAPGKAL
jgi:hypothetical protein